MWHQNIDAHGRPYWVNALTGQATYQFQQGGAYNPHYANPASPNMGMGVGPPAAGMAYSPTQGPSYDMTGSSFSSNDSHGDFSRTARHVTQAAAFTLLIAGAARQKMPQPFASKGRRQHLSRTINNARKIGSPGKI